eukprot:8124545-Pyramimonas_sp.AAC.1
MGVATSVEDSANAARKDPDKNASSQYTIKHARLEAKIVASRRNRWCKHQGYFHGGNCGKKTVEWSTKGRHSPFAMYIRAHFSEGVTGPFSASPCRNSNQVAFSNTRISEHHDYRAS